MKTVLIYTHTRNIFIGNKFKPFVDKYFKDARFEGSDGGWCAELSVSNYEEVKDILPKYARPESVKNKI